MRKNVTLLMCTPPYPKPGDRQTTFIKKVPPFSSKHINGWRNSLSIESFLWKGFEHRAKMNVSTFWAIFLPLKSNTPGPFSIMLSSPLLKHNISFFIPCVLYNQHFSEEKNDFFKDPPLTNQIFGLSLNWTSHYLLTNPKPKLINLKKKSHYIF